MRTSGFRFGDGIATILPRVDISARIKSHRSMRLVKNNIVKPNIAPQTNI